MTGRPDLFGWCMTGHHAQCRASYDTNWSGQTLTRVCACDCHRDQEEE